MTDAALLLLALLARAEPAAPAALDPGFEVSIVRSADLDGDGFADLLLADGRRAAVFFGGPEGVAAAPDLAFPLPDDAVFVDVSAEGLLALTAAGVRVAAFAERAAGSFEPVPGLEGPLAVRPVAGGVLDLDFVRDLDGAGPDDAILPVAGGYRVHLRSVADAPFGPGGLVPIAPVGAFSFGAGSDLAGIEQRLSWPRVFDADLEGDGRREIVTFDGRVVRAHARPDLGAARWPTVLERLLYAGEPELAEELFEARNVRVEDLDGTGASVLLVVRASAGEIDLFARGAEGAFARHDVLRLDGWLLPPKLIDLDGDGRLDLLAPSTPALGPLQLAKLLATRRFTMTYAIFRNRPDGRFARTPDAVRRIDFPLHYRGDAATPVESSMAYTFDADVDGDGRKDFVVRQEPAALAVHRGDGVGGFEERPFARIALDAPADRPLALEVVDLDGDGRSDLLLRFADDAGRSAWRLVRGAAVQ